MLYAEVPAERILSCPVTGFGCKRESEYVVLGSQKKAGEEVLASTISKSNVKEARFWFDLFDAAYDYEALEKISEGIAKHIK